jgi:ectoine hydroxylase-related dioxygenase (phytanoyl-CoA dioxygenase family)
VKWHQEQPFFPQTNHAVATFGVYLEDCGPEQGPLCILPGSQNQPNYSHCDAAGTSRGDLTVADASALDTSGMVEFMGPAGSATVHNYVTGHSSRQNLSDLRQHAARASGAHCDGGDLTARGQIVARANASI